MKQMFNRYATTQEITEQFAGKKQGSYTVLYAIRKPYKGDMCVFFVCQCECGKKITVRPNEFKHLHKCQSCCQITHGKSYTKLYKSYTCMRERCYYPHNNRYYAYGGRGIKMCDEWFNDRNSFFDWAINNGYKEGLTIDRINVNGNYCPENCRWITKTEQCKNKRNTVLITYNGKTHCLSDWANICGIKACTLRRRLFNGWDIEKALTTPVK